MTSIDSKRIIENAESRYKATQGHAYPMSLNAGDKILVEEIAYAVNMALDAREHALAATIREVAASRTPSVTNTLNNVIAKQGPSQREIGTYEKIANVLGFEPSSTAAVLDAVIAHKNAVRDHGDLDNEIRTILEGVDKVSPTMMLHTHASVVAGVRELAACWERQKKVLKDVDVRTNAHLSEKAKATEACAHISAENKRLEKEATLLRATITSLQDDLQRTRQASDNKDGVIARKDDTIAEISRQRMLAATVLRDFKERFETVRRALTP